jgi:hypothetical protein
LSEFIGSRKVQADAFRSYCRTHDPKTLDTNPVIYPIDTDLAGIVDNLRALGRWPATLSGEGNAQLPFLSRVASRAGSWGWGLIGLGAVSAWLACRKRTGPGDPNGIEPLEL